MSRFSPNRPAFARPAARAVLVASSFVAGLALLGACMRTSASATPSTASAPASMSDANIAAVVVAANAADISYGEIALAKSSHAGVRGFAQRMITDHTGVNRAAVELVTRLGVTPEDNEASLDLRDDAETKRDELRALSGAAFDSAYVANEVTYHKRVLAAVDGALIPSARNAELRALLVSVRPAFVAHLAHAEELQRSLRK